jgi:ankyrin repeat protein
LNGNTVLHNAAESGYTAVVKQLFAAGADPTKENNRGKTSRGRVCHQVLIII